MANPYDFQSPKHLFAFDDAVLDRVGEDILQKINDQLGIVREHTLVVEFSAGVQPHARLTQTDYLVIAQGQVIVRQSDGVTLNGWYGAEEPVEGQAVRFLADEFMIPVSEIYYFTTVYRASMAEMGVQVFVIDGEGGERTTAPEQVTFGSDEIPEILERLNVPSRAVGGRSMVEEEAFERALDTLNRNVTRWGFTAASLADNALMTHDSNYAAVWSRDGIITGLWTLCVGNNRLDKCFKDTLVLLAEHQAESGQIPSYVRIKDQSPDYSGIGGIASIDSVLWFVIGTIRYVFRKKDRAFARRMAPHLSLAMVWLRAHDSNNDGLLELPESSDWMDLFPRSYNVLYDEVLWYQACEDYAVFLEALREEDGSTWRRTAETIKQRIIDLFWPGGEQLVELAGSSSGRFSLGEARYLLSQVTPFDYSWRCDVFANLLAALTGLLSPSKQDRLFTFLWGVGVNSPYPVACLYPTIHSGSDDWKDYFMVNFLNLPHHYHNGGLWPLVGGLWVRFLYDLGRVELAYRELTGLAEACRAGIHGEWEFNEWLHGQTGRPMGKAHQAWSAASYVKAYLTVKDKTESAAFEPLDVNRLLHADGHAVETEYVDTP